MRGICWGTLSGMRNSAGSLWRFWREYEFPETGDKLWERIYMEHLDELRGFDETYVTATRSHILAHVAEELHCQQKEIREVKAYKDHTNEAAGFTFTCRRQSMSIRTEIIH